MDDVSHAQSLIGLIKLITPDCQLFMNIYNHAMELSTLSAQYNNSSAQDDNSSAQDNEIVYDNIMGKIMSIINTFDLETYEIFKGLSNITVSTKLGLLITTETFIVPSIV